MVRTTSYAHEVLTPNTIIPQKIDKILIFMTVFDFHDLRVYKRAKDINKEVLNFLKYKSEFDRYLKDQLKRASISIVLNIAEGSGKFSKKDRKNFYTIARGSVYECVSLFEIILDEKQIIFERYKYFFNKYEIISKMLLGLIRSQE